MSAMFLPDDIVTILCEGSVIDEGSVTPKFFQHLTRLQTVNSEKNVKNHFVYRVVQTDVISLSMPILI